MSDDNSLREYLAGSPMRLADFIGLSILITELVYREQQQIAFIGSLSPSTIHIQWDGKTARLSEDREWNEVYQSPEQTGRINYVPDSRSDLYSLGIIFYEMLTGQLPFAPENNGEWAAAHIGLTPLPLSEIQPEGKGALESIVLKLLSKSPEDRYQSAYGLLDDLKQCERMLVTGEQLQHFEIGRMDQIRSFYPSKALYGRGAAIEQLQAGLEQAARGQHAFKYISGPEGSGKTALVHQLLSNITERDGRFIEGKSDQLHQAGPLEPFLQAMRQWIHQLWSEPTGVIALLKQRLRTACRDEAPTIISVLPEARPLFEIQLEVTPALAPATATIMDSDDTDVWKRFGSLLPVLIRCFVEVKSPLVLFIDNLQWADEDTHAAIRTLVLEDTIPGLLIITACQNEVQVEPDNSGLESDLAPAVSPQVLGAADTADHITLHPLRYEDVRQYVVDTLHEDSVRTGSIARALYYQTNGNPRAMHLLLEEWTREQKLVFDDKQRQWIWDAGIMRQLEDSKVSRHLMEQDFAQLQDETKLLLAVAAAIGPSFRLSFLIEISEHTAEITRRMLHDAEVHGIVFREGDPESENGQEHLYMFLHDHLHQLAYAFDAGRNAQRHLKIGRVLQDRQSPSSDDDKILELVEHLNRGMTEMSGQEKRQLAEFNLRIGQKTLKAGQYGKARQCAEAGLALIEGDQDMEMISVSFQLKLTLAWSDYMDGNIEQAKQLLLNMNKSGDELNRAARSQLWAILIEIHMFDENETSVAYGKEALAAYGWELRDKVSKLSVVKEMLQTRFYLSRKRAGLRTISPNHDEEYAALSSHVERLFIPLLIYNAVALVDLYARFIRYGMSKGMNDSLAGIMCVYELLVRRAFPDHVQAAFVDDLQSIASAALGNSSMQPIFDYMKGIVKQLEHPFDASVYLEKALREGLELGKISFANMAMITCLLTHNRDMYVFSDLLTFFNNHLRQHANDKTLEIVQIASHYLAALQDEALQERFIAIPETGSETELGGAGEDNFSYICKLEVAYLSGEYHKALYWAGRARENELALDHVRIWKHRLYETLTLAALYPEANEVERKRISKTMRQQLRLMKQRKGFLGADSSAYLLLKAEWVRIADDEWRTLRGYLEAINQAKTEKYGLMEGISCDRLANFYQNGMLSRSGATIAAMDACNAYSLWGITSKVTQIRYEYVNQLRVVEQSEALTLVDRSEEADVEEIQTPGDEEKLLQQIIDWPGKLQGESWEESFLKAAIRQTGADRGAVLRSRGNGGFHTLASSEAERLESDKSAMSIAVSVLRHTVMTQETVMLEQAWQTHFIKDSYIREYRPKSVLCMPVVVPGERYPVLLYLENRHLPGVFTKRNVNVLELLATRILYFNRIEEEEAPTEIHPPSMRDTACSELIEPLTERESEVLAVIAEGLSNKDIAARFAIAETTVKTHTTRILGKLGVKRRGQAVIRARELQLLGK